MLNNNFQTYSPELESISLQKDARKKAVWQVLRGCYIIITSRYLQTENQRMQQRKHERMYSHPTHCNM